MSDDSEAGDSTPDDPDPMPTSAAPEPHAYPWPVCASCGQWHVTKDRHQACSGHSKNDPSKPCGQAPLTGLTKCRMHGPKKSDREAGRRKVAAERQQSEIAAAVSLSVDAWRGRHPIESVEDARATASAMVEEVRSRLAESDFDVPDPPEGGDRGERVAPLRQSITMELLRQWTDLAGKLGKASLDAGTEERKVRLDEAQGAALVDAFRRFEAAMLQVVVEALEAPAGSVPCPHCHGSGVQITGFGAPESVVARVRSAWSSHLPAVVRAATEPAAIDAREVGG